MLTHVPFMLQSRSHARCWHALPVKPSAHSHSPVPASHRPRFEHSLRAWATSSDDATSAQA